jgi:hypothetical protein
MVINDYQSIETNEVSTDGIPFVEQKQEGDTKNWIRRNVMVTVAIAVTLGLIAISFTISAGMTSGTTNTAAIVLMRKHHGKKVRKCSFGECLTATCQFLTAPYICLEFGGPYDGCSSTPWIIPGTYLIVIQNQHQKV